jgi:hypothetical protein
MPLCVTATTYTQQAAVGAATAGCWVLLANIRVRWLVHAEVRVLQELTLHV